MTMPAIYHFKSTDPEVIDYMLIATNRRLTLDIAFQHAATRWQGDDEGDYPVFTASNGYEVISQSRMDIQTKRLWLLGSADNMRSGTMVFSSNEKRDRAACKFQEALTEWARWHRQTNKGVDVTPYEAS